MARPAGHKLSPVAWEDVLNLTGDTLTDISQRSGVPRATLSSLLGGHHTASRPVAKAIARAAGVRSATLFPSLLANDEDEADDDVEIAELPAKKKAAATSAASRRPRWV